MASTLSLTSLAAPGSEQDLVAAARAGDDQAFSELYSRYQDRIRGFILAKVHDHGRAEDIAQDVFISALRRLRSSDQTIVFKPWIYEIAKNACIDEFRRHRRNREVSLDSDEEFASGRRGLLSIAPTPPAAVDRKLQLDDLQGAFGGLSENHHKLLVMREFEGRSYNEIAASTGMSLQMVESALFRARRKLSEEYDELASGRRCEQVQAAIETGRMQSLRSIGIRERRQLTRHLAHCQPCRREARLAGVDESLVKPRSIAARIAALLPFPLWRWPWGGGSSGAVAGAAGPTGSSVTLGQAAAAVAALAIAGAGGGAVTGLWAGKHPLKSTPVSRTATLTPAASASASAARVAAGARVARIAASSTATARHGAGTATSRHGLTKQQIKRLSHFSHRRNPVSTAHGSKSPTSKKTSSPTGTPRTSAPTGNPITSTPTKTGSKTTTGPLKTVTKAAGPVAGVPKKVVSTLKSATRSTVSTVDKVVSTVTSTLPVKVQAPSLSKTLGSILPGSGSTTPTAPAAGPPAVAPVVAGTTKTVTGVAKTVTGTVASTVSGILSP